MEKIGKYQILDKLGQGGMGVVYKALDTLIERAVAVKIIASNLDADPELRTRFFREGRAAGQLSHKNIVTIFDLGEDDGTAYIAMEFLEGEDLRSMLQKGEPLDLQEKIRIMTEVCEGLAHAHSKNVIHRDIKPANIFITRNGQVKILDFGLARTVASDLTTSGHALGTPNYMSPEQVRGEKVDCRTDIFSVGVSFYELLTHRKAFQGDSFTSTIFKILQDDPEPIEHFDPTVSQDLCAIIYKALAKDREQRYHTLRALIQDLDTVCGSGQAGFIAAAGRSELSRLEGRESPQLSKGGAALSGMKDATPRGFSSGPGKTKPGMISHAAGSHPSQKPLRPIPEDTLPDPSVAVREESTEVEALSAPHRPSSFRRYLAGVSAVAVILVGLVWMVSHFRTAKSDGPERNVTSAAVPAVEQTHPSSPPAVSQSQPPPVSEQESPTSLERAANALKSRRFSEAAREAEQVLKSSPGNTEAQSILQKARESLDSIRTGIRDTKSYIASGDISRARSALTEVLRIAPSDAEALQLEGQLNQSRRQSAEQSFHQMKDAKSSAADAHASELAPQTLVSAQAHEREANDLLARGKFEEAAGKSTEAAGLYRRAENEARAEVASRAERARSAEAERQQGLLRARSDTARQGFEQERELATQIGAADKARDQFREAEKIASGARARSDAGDFNGALHDYDAAAAAMRQARGLALEAGRKEAARPPEPIKPAATPTAAGRPAAASPVTLEASQKAIHRLPEQYKTAMESKDLSLLKIIWPGLAAQQEQAFQKQWAYTRSLRMILQKSKIEKLEGDAALLTVQLHIEQQIENGPSRKSDQKASFSLTRKDSLWVIENVTFEAIR